MGIRLPGHLAWALDLLDLEWPEIDENEFEAAATGHRRMAALADEAAADAHAGARIVSEANDGRSVGAFASYWRRGPVARIDRLTEIFSMAASMEYAMADHVTDVKFGVIWELDGLLDELLRASAAAAHVGTALSKAAMQRRPFVTRARESTGNRLGDLEGRLTSEILRLRTAWLSGGSGVTRSILAVDYLDGLLAFDPLTYERGARQIVQAAENMAMASNSHSAMRGRTASQLRQWPPTLWAAAALEEIEADFSDMIRRCVLDLLLTGDSLRESRVTMLETEARNTALVRQVVASLRQVDSVGDSTQSFVSGMPRRISRILNGDYLYPDTWSQAEDPYTGFHRPTSAW